MLLSIVVWLAPESAGSLPRTSGRLLHAAVLNLIGEYAPLIADALHADYPNKPFTLSDLHEDDSHAEVRGRFRAIKPERLYWFRITSIDATLSDVFAELLAAVGARLMLKQIGFRVVEATAESTAHGWAGWSDWETLASGGGSGNVRLQFASATSFRSGDQNQPWPAPRLVFRSLAEKWRCHAPYALAERANSLLCKQPATEPAAGSETDATAHSGILDRIYVSRFDVRSAMLDFGSYKRVGCIGEVEYECSGAARSDAPDWCFVRQLANFAFFAGVGERTAMGMGQVRRVQGGAAPHRETSHRRKR